MFMYMNIYVQSCCKIVYFYYRRQSFLRLILQLPVFSQYTTDLNILVYYH